MLVLGAQAKCSAFFHKIHPSNSGSWLWTGQPQVGVGDGNLVPHWGIQGSSSLGPAAAPFYIPTLDHLGTEDGLWWTRPWEAIGRRKEEGQGDGNGLNPFSWGSLLRPAWVGGQDRCLFTCWDGEWGPERRGVPLHLAESLLLKETFLSEYLGLL